jgi:hypothetical protein
MSAATSGTTSRTSDLVSMMGRLRIDSLVGDQDTIQSMRHAKE